MSWIFTDFQAFKRYRKEGKDVLFSDSVYVRSYCEVAVALLNLVRMKSPV